MLGSTLIRILRLNSLLALIICIHSTRLSTLVHLYTCTLEYLYTLKKFTNYEAGFSVEVMIIYINLYLWCITAHYDAPRYFFLLKTQKLKPLVCIALSFVVQTWKKRMTFGNIEFCNNAPFCTTSNFTKAFFCGGNTTKWRSHAILATVPYSKYNFGVST